MLQQRTVQVFVRRERRAPTRIVVPVEHRFREPKRLVHIRLACAPSACMRGRWAVCLCPPSHFCPEVHRAFGFTAHGQRRLDARADHRRVEYAVKV